METILLQNGYLELPDEIRRRMGLDAGTRFEVRVDARTGEIMLKPVCCEYFSNRVKRENKSERLLLKPARKKIKTG